MSDERFEQDLRDAVRGMAPSGAPDSLRQRALAVPSTAPTRSLFAPWGIAAGVAVAGVAAIAILVVALAPKPVGPRSSGSPTPSASAASAPNASIPVVGVTPAPTPTPAPTGSPSTRYLSWSSLPIPGTGATATGVTTFGGGFVAVGQTQSACCGNATGFDPNAHAWVWRYTNAAGWVLAPNQPAFMLGDMRAVAASDRVILAIGVRALESGPEPATWTSNDGLTWQLHRQVRRFTTVTSSPFGFFGVAATPDGPEIWSSADGAAWNRVADSSTMGPGLVAALRYTSVGLVAVGYVEAGRSDPIAGRKAVSWHSANGTTWQRSPEQASLAVGTMQDVGASRSIIVAVGFVDADGRPGAWRSADGLHWEQSRDPALPAWFGDLRHVIGVPSGFLATGMSADGAGDLVAAQWTSTDGRTWAVISPGQPGPAGDQLDISGWVATANGSVLSVGFGNNGITAVPASWWATP
jgi:hypothetical protein